LGGEPFPVLDGLSRSLRSRGHQLDELSQPSPLIGIMHPPGDGVDAFVGG
jgi:hypothetical protein